MQFQVNKEFQPIITESMKIPVTPSSCVEKMSSNIFKEPIEDEISVREMKLKSLEMMPAAEFSENDFEKTKLELCEALKNCPMTVDCDLPYHFSKIVEAPAAAEQRLINFEKPKLDMREVFKRDAMTNVNLSFREMLRSSSVKPPAAERAGIHFEKARSNMFEEPVKPILDASNVIELKISNHKMMPVIEYPGNHFEKVKSNEFKEPEEHKLTPLSVFEFKRIGTKMMPVIEYPGNHFEKAQNVRKMKSRKCGCERASNNYYDTLYYKARKAALLSRKITTIPEEKPAEVNSKLMSDVNKRAPWEREQGAFLERKAAFLALLARLRHYRQMSKKEISEITQSNKQLSEVMKSLSNIKI